MLLKLIETLFDEGEHSEKVRSTYLQSKRIWEKLLKDNSLDDLSADLEKIRIAERRCTVLGNSYAFVVTGMIVVKQKAEQGPDVEIEEHLKKLAKIFNQLSLSAENHMYIREMLKALDMDPNLSRL